MIRRTRYGMVFAAGCLVALMAHAQLPNTLTPQDKQGGWQLLFNGKNLDGWHSYLQKGTGKDWSVVDGAIQLNKRNSDPAADWADVVTDGEYRNFDLKLEWKQAPCTDGGIMWDVHESPEYGNTYETGPEMQIADLACTVPDSRVLMERSGDLFDMIPAPYESVKDAGQWNEVEIIQNNGHVQFFQNGRKTVDTQMWGAKWNDMVAHTKFAKMPGYGKYHQGHISIQGTEPKGAPGDRLWFRNIRIKRLPG